MSLRAFCACQGVKNTVHKYHVSQRWWIYRLATTTRSVPDPAGCFCCLPGKTPWQKRNIGQDGSKPLQASLRRLLRSSWHSFQLPFVTEWRDTVDTDTQVQKETSSNLCWSALVSVKQSLLDDLTDFLLLKSSVSLQRFWVRKDLEKDSFSWTETAAVKSPCHP